MRYWDGSRWTDHTAPMPPTEFQDPTAERQRIKAELRADRAASRAEQRTERAAARAEQARAEAEQYGDLVLTDSFAGRTIRLYSRGYVRVTLLIAHSGAPFERLHAVEFSGDVQKKRGLSRGAIAVATGGVNLMTSNKRGDLWLSITTDRTTRVLHVEPPTAHEIRSGRKIASAGEALLAGPLPTREQPPPPPPPSSSSSAAGPNDVKARLVHVDALLAQGVISPDEHRAQRQRILDEL